MKLELRAAICVLAAGCSPAVLPEARWRDAVARPAGGACTVTFEHAGTGSWIGTRIYAADGRPIWGQIRRERDSQREERVEHDAAGRVAAVVSRYEREFQAGNCDVEGGCDEPALRELARMQLAYDAGGRIARASTETTRFRLDGERWIEAGTDREVVGFRYDGDGRLIERYGPGGTMRFEHRGDALVEVSVRAAHSSRFRVERDAAGRVARIDRGHAVQTFEHDAAGRLIRTVWDHQGDAPDEDQAWRYDAAGRLASWDRGYARRPDADRNTITYRHDDLGRLSARVHGSTVLTAYRYQGACDRAVIEPAAAPPHALEIAFGPSCATSPGGLVQVCAPPLR